MLEIKIAEFGDYDRDALFEYLSLQEQHNFRLVMSKKSLAHKDENYIIYWNYYLAAFVGQKLYDLSSRFEYFVPSEHAPLDFIFLFETKDIAKLSEVISEIINGCYHDNEAYTKFHNEGSKFYDAAISGKIRSATFGLLRVADKYLD